MLLPQQQSFLTELIQSTVVRVCVEHVPFEGRLELDGLVCINSDVGGARQIVVKIHTVVGRKDVLAERMVANKTSWPVTPLLINKNGLSQNSADAVPLDARALAHEDTSSAASEALEDGDYRAGEMVDERIPPWSRHAPQILRLLTKSDATSDKSVQPTTGEVCPTSSAGLEKMSDAVVKREPAVSEGANAMEVDANGDHHHSAKWRCKMCQLLCANFTELESHMRNVHVRFVCRLCLNSFTLSCNLRRHMKLHAGVRPHSCPFCSASFSRSTDLKIHMKKHPAANANSGSDSPKSVQTEPLSLKKAAVLYECDLCSKGFAAAAHLAEHRRTHTVNTEHQVVAAENDRQILCNELITSTANSSCQSHSINLSVSVSHDSTQSPATGPVDFSETVREFAPLFHLGDAGIDSTESGKASTFLANITQQSNFAKAPTPVRSKRKGLPVKRIDVGNDDDEMAVDDVQSLVNGAAVVKNETMTDARADADMSAGSSQISETNNANSDVSSGDLEAKVINCQNVGSFSAPCHEQPLSATSADSDAASAEMNDVKDAIGATNSEITSGDLESKVFTCQYAGGCAVTCLGFSDYERHYRTAHGGRYPCSLCPQSFTSRNNRRRHTDGHAGAAGHGRHQCVTCGKRFARADIIKDHRLTHTHSYQRGTCSKCGEPCSTKKSSLLLHLKRCLTAAEIDADIVDARVAEPASTD